MQAHYDLEEAKSSDSTTNPVFSSRSSPAASATPPSHIQPQSRGTSERPQPNRWKDSICNWPSNLFPSCYCACFGCFGIYLLAQIAKKVGYTSFIFPLLTFGMLTAVGILVTAFFGYPEIVVLLPFSFAFCFTLGLRLHIAARDRISENGGLLGECCCGFWCWSCSVAQMARHVYGYSRVLDGDGNPHRLDYYVPLRQRQQQLQQQV